MKITLHTKRLKPRLHPLVLGKQNIIRPDKSRQLDPLKPLILSDNIKSINGCERRGIERREVRGVGDDGLGDAFVGDIEIEGGVGVSGAVVP
jgi:hypothetical protein